MIRRWKTWASPIFILIAVGCDGLVGADGGNNSPPDAGPVEPARSPWVSDCLGDRTCVDPHVVSHRGEGTGAPENSLAAIDEAFALGADIVEIDVRVTADNIPILLHDTTLIRTTNQEEVDASRDEVVDWTYEELQELTLFDPMSLCESEDTFTEARCRLPTFAQAIQLAKGQGMLMLDYKAAASDLETVAMVLLDEGAEDTVFFFDSDLQKNIDIAAMVPGLVVMPRAYSGVDVAEIIELADPFLIHIEPGFTQDAKEASEGSGAKLFADVFLEFDFYIVASEINGDGDNVEIANQTIFELLDKGADILQSNRPVELRQAVNIWAEMQ
jgi:glycerophosphoryl diester phosphodiesterase